MHKIPDELLRHIQSVHAAATHRQKRQVVENWAAKLALSPATIYRKIDMLDRSATVAVRRADFGKPRVAAWSIFEHDMRVIAGIMYAASKEGEGSFLAVEIAIDIAWNHTYDDGTHAPLISQKYTVATVTRWLKRMDIHQRGFQRRTKAVRIVTEHPNQVGLVDATVSKLYYLTDKGRLVLDESIARDSSHAEDRIRSKGYKKIWLYVYVDHFSKSFHGKGYADYRLGENSHDLFDFLSECFLEKSHCPVHGIPDVLYGDKGSALMSKLIERLCIYFEIKRLHHFPHNPRAKGPVESRIGKVQSRIEKLLLMLPPTERPGTIEEYNEFVQAHIRSENSKTGKWLLWHQNIKTHLRTATPENMLESIVEPFTRIVNAYGCISVENIELEIENGQGLIGEKVDVYRNYSGSMVVKHGEDLFQLKRETIKVPWGEYKSFAKTEGQLNQGLVKLEAENFRSNLTRRQLMPQEDNIRHLPVAGEAIQKTGPIPLDEYDSVEAAWLFLAGHTGHARGELPDHLRENIDKFFNSLINMGTTIRGKDLLKVANALQQQIKKEIPKHG